MWEEGEKKFGDKINQEKNKQEEFLKKTLNFDELKKKFGGELPTDELNHISSSFEDKLGEVKKAVNLAGMNPMGKLKGLFWNDLSSILIKYFWWNALCIYIFCIHNEVKQE